MIGDSVSRVLLREEAKHRQYEVSYFGKNNEYIVFRDPKTGKINYFKGTRLKQNSASARDICVDKVMTLDFIKTVCKIDVPAYAKYSDLDAAKDFLSQQKEIVVKPADSYQSKGVTVGISNESSLEAAIRDAREVSQDIILQKHLRGKLYRILVIGGGFAVATREEKTFAIGDGVKTVAELLHEINANPLRGTDALSPMVKIKMVDVEKMYDARVGMRVLAEGEKIAVTNLESIGAGGEAINLDSNEIHDSIKKCIEKIADDLGLLVCGFDIIVDDIGEDIGNYLPLCEINSMPGIRMHHFPAQGEPFDAAAKILDVAFSEV